MPWLINTPNLVESFTYLSNQGHVNQYVKIALKTAKSAHPDHLNTPVFLPENHTCLDVDSSNISERKSEQQPHWKIVNLFTVPQVLIWHP